MNTRTTIADKVKRIVADKLRVDPLRVVPDAAFVADLEADSLDLVELVMAMEETFDIDIVDEEAERLTTVRDAIDYIVLR